MLKVGDPAPEFTARTHEGKEVSLSDYRGKTVVLYFYPKADTPGCTAESCGFRDQAPAYAGKNAEILGVSFDTPEENAAFAQKYHLPFPLLCDTDRQLSLAYGACDSPMADYPRRITYVIGPDGRIVQALGKVDARQHPQDLLSTL
jgi:peroxiredoxin Q/BCP